VGKKRLSLLIPTLNDRSTICDQITSEIVNQLTTDVEMLILPDDGEKNIGAKRNILLEGATGDYVAFIDDDDMISKDYVEKVLAALEGNPDCASLDGYVYWSDGRKRLFKHSIEYTSWYTSGDVDYRMPGHLNAVKREYALQARFPEISYAEDHQYSKDLQQYLKTEGKIEGVIYHYYQSTEFPKALRSELLKNIK
jgi:glycosyltransferase involved in cell wall biosynthesis